MDVPRIGDTVISHEMRPFVVLDNGYDETVGTFWTEAEDQHGRTRTFPTHELECVDYDDGLWQHYRHDHG